MKAWNVFWTDGGKNSKKSGSTIVIAESITKAIAQFQQVYHPVRTIESVYHEGNDVLFPEGGVGAF